SSYLQVSRLMRRAAAAWAGVLAAALSGCAVGPDFERPAPPDVQRYAAAPAEASTSGSGTVPAQRLHAGMDIPAQWWTLFRSPALDQLVRQALEQSPTLQQARA